MYGANCQVLCGGDRGYRGIIDGLPKEFANRSRFDYNTSNECVNFNILWLLRPGRGNCAEAAGSIMGSAANNSAANNLVRPA